MNRREKHLPYGLHSINQQDIEAVKKVLEGNQITQGPKIKQFEHKLASYIGTKYAIAVNNGTAALELGIKANGIQNGRIITTPFTFVATANAALFNNTKVDFVDIDKETFNIDIQKIEENIYLDTKAILPVHFAGQCCKMNQITNIAKRYKLQIIEDCCHALGAELDGKKAGSFGTGCFSFHPVKHITSGEGGAITTNNKKVYERLLSLREHGIDRKTNSKKGYGYDVKELSRNFRISDISCSLALSQFQRLESFLKRRNEIASRYNETLQQIKGIQTPKELFGQKHAWHIYCILVENRDKLFKFLRKQNIGVNVHYIPIYRHTLYKRLYNLNPKDFPNTEYVFERILTLPIYPKMTNQDVDYVISKVKEGITKCSK